MWTIRIEGTGSSGNCSVVNDSILMDMGLSAKRMADDFGIVTAALITHRHGDHVTDGALSAFFKQRPAIFKNQLYMPKDVYDAVMERGHAQAMDAVSHIPDEHLLRGGETFGLRTRSGKYTVTCFMVPHGDVPNLGYVIENEDGSRLLWATDLENLGTLPQGKFDAICLEGSYDETVLGAALDDPVLATRAASNLRHLPIADFERFVTERANTNALVVQLHQSKDFGRRSPLNTCAEGDVISG